MRKNKVQGVNKKNAKKKGSGIIDDIYRVGAKILTGENVPKNNKFAVPELNANISAKDPRLIVFSQYAGPGTDIRKQLKKNAKPVNAVDLVAQLHDVQYQLARNKRQIREADNVMMNQLSSSLANDVSFMHPIRSLENLIVHPIKTTANIINKGAALGAISAKTVLEDLGAPVYGVSSEIDAKFRKQLEQKKIQLIQ